MFFQRLSVVCGLHLFDFIDWTEVPRSTRDGDMVRQTQNSVARRGIEVMMVGKYGNTSEDGRGQGPAIMAADTP